MDDCCRFVVGLIFSPSDLLKEALAVAGGAVPMFFVGYATSPFALAIHMRIPFIARQSKEQLLRWSNRIPSNTEIDVTTMRFFGLPRISRLYLADLQRKKGGNLLTGNLLRISADPQKPVSKFQWMSNEPRRFYADPLPSKGKELLLWQRVWESVKSQ